MGDSESGEEEEDDTRARRRTKLQHQSHLSAFDQNSLKRLSTASQSYNAAGTAVNVTRTLSISQQQWENVLCHPSLALSSDGKVAPTSKDGKDHRFRSIFGLPMISPAGKFSKSWHLVMVLMDLTYTAFCVPIGVGFDVSDTAWTWVAVLDFTAGLIFMADLLLGFHTGYVVSFRYKKRIVMDGKQVARWYALRGSFWVDFLSSVAWVTQVILVILTVLGYNQERLASQIQIIRILRLSRLARLFKILFLSGVNQGLLSLLINSQRMSATLGYFMQLLYAIAFTINLLGSLWYWIADREGINNTWITEYEPYVREYGGASGVIDAAIVDQYISKPRLYLTSVYWAFTTVATVGYGDITPQTALEQGVTIFAFLVGIIFFGVVIGSLTQLLQRASKEARKAELYREKMGYVDSWLHGRKFPNRLRQQIRDYYGQFWLRQADEADEAKLLEELPHALRTEALWSMARKSITNAAVFAGVPTPLKVLLASVIQPRTYPPGQDVSMQGAPATRMWLMHFGQVVPVYNDIEGDVQSDTYLLNGTGLLQEIHPQRFQKNVRGYRTATACGLWEWSISTVLGICKHHPGLYHLLLDNLLAEMDRHSQEQPESFPPAFAERLEEARDKFGMNAHEEFIATPSFSGRHGSERPYKGVGDLQSYVSLNGMANGSGDGGGGSFAMPADDPAGQAFAHGNAPGTEQEGTRGSTEKAEACSPENKSMPSIRFSDSTKGGDEAAAAAGPRPQGAMGPPRLKRLRVPNSAHSALDLHLSTLDRARLSHRALSSVRSQRRQRELRLALRDASNSGADSLPSDGSDSAESGGEGVSQLDVASSLSAIQDQLADLRALVQRSAALS